MTVYRCSHCSLVCFLPAVSIQVHLFLYIWPLQVPRLREAERAFGAQEHHAEASSAKSEYFSDRLSWCGNPSVYWTTVLLRFVEKVGYTNNYVPVRENVCVWWLNLKALVACTQLSCEIGPEMLFIVRLVYRFQRGQPVCWARGFSPCRPWWQSRTHRSRWSFSWSRRFSYFGDFGRKIGYAFSGDREYINWRQKVERPEMAPLKSCVCLGLRL